MVKDFYIDKIPVRVYKPNKSVEQVLIGVHGFTGSQNSSTLTYLGNKLEDTNIMLITFDLPNHGARENEKALSLKECLDNLRVIEEYAFFISDNVSYISNSFGAYLTLLHLNEDRDAPIKKVILKSPAIYMDEILKNEILPFNGIDFEEFKALENIALKDKKGIIIDYKFYSELNKNCLENILDKKYFVNVIQGKQDEIIDIVKNERFFDVVFNKHHKIYYFENATHSFKNDEDKEKLVEIVKEILLG